MTTIYNVDKFVQGVNGFGTPFCDTIFTASLKAATDTTLTVPTTAAMGLPTATQHNKFLAVITCQSAKQVYVAVNATAAVPAGATFAASTSELLPDGDIMAKYCKSGDTLHFICAAIADVSVAFYAILD